MPRIAIPEDYADAPLAYVVQHVAPELTTPLYALSKAVYLHSILSLREFEAVRARRGESGNKTGNVNGQGQGATLEDALEATRIGVALRESLRTGQAVVL